MGRLVCALRASPPWGQAFYGGNCSVVAILLMGCALEPQPAPEIIIPSEGPAEIVGVVWTCYPEAGVWTLDVETIGWSGVGRLFLATPTEDQAGGGIEAHSFGSEGAAADGSSDCLGLYLPAVADWQDANPSFSTRFDCSQEAEVNALLVVSDAQGVSWSDCRVWGPDPSIFEGEEGIPACDRLLSEDELDLDSCG
jgi:hypothetical protein